MTPHIPGLRRIWIPGLVLALFLAACGQDDGGTGPILPPGDAEFQAVLDTGGDMPNATASTDTTVTDEGEETREDGTRWLCRTKTVSLFDNPETYVTFDPNSDVVYPGSLVQGGSIANATPDPVVVERAGGTISIDLLNGSNGVFVEVDEMSMGKIRQAMNDIIDQNTGIGAARFSYDFYEVQSRQQLAASLGVNVETLSSSFNADLSFSSDKQYNRFVVKLVQSYYSMSWDLPTGYDKVFAPDVTAEQLDRYVGPGNPCVYISTVTYGRIFYLLVESTASREEMRASIDASYKAAVAGGSIDGDVKYVTQLADSRVKAFALGGDPNLALDAVFNTNYESLRDYLTQGGDIKTGLPLSYKMRALKDNKTVKVQVATEYTVHDCVPILVAGPDPLFRFLADEGVTSVDIGVGLGAVSKWANAWGEASKDAVPPWNKYCGWLYENDVRGKGDAIGFQWWSEGVASLTFPGQDLRNTDYTLFVVAESRVQPGEGTAYFVWGNTTEAGLALRLGFNDETVIMEHGQGQRLEVTSPVLTQTDYQLYTFRFSQTEGMSIYVNGVLRGSDPTLTMPLASFSSARMGVTDESGGDPGVWMIFLGEIQAYGKAMTDAERQDVEDEILDRYGL
jgi:hypothetical protein